MRRGRVVPAARSVPVVGDSPEMRDWAEQLVARARAEGVELTGDNGLLTAMVRQVLQTGLNVEMAEHLGYEPYAVDGPRVGQQPQRVVSEDGDDRDRPGRAARCLATGWAPSSRSRCPSSQRRLDGLTGNVISLYAKGMTTGDIQAHLAEIYGTEISRETISKITDAIVDDMLAWQHRPLDRGLSGDVDRLHRGQDPRLARSPTGRSTWRSGSTSTANATCSGCGSARPAGKARSSGRRCSPSSATVASPTR